MNDNDVSKDFSRIWLENYLGTSEIAKTLDEFLKSTYNGANYLPWATMVRVLYQLDPNAQIIKHQNENGGYVFTDRLEYIVYKDKENIPQSAFSHMVKLSVIFLGKTFTEAYPIQNQKYEAPKFYDQNLVNKALQRGLARCIAMATGIGLYLYEKGELQFENDGETEATPESTINANKKAKSPIVTGAVGVAMPTEGELPPLEALVNLVVTNSQNAEVVKLAKTYNGVLKAKYGVEFSIEEDAVVETVESLTNKLKDIKNCETMLKGFRKVTNNAN